MNLYILERTDNVDYDEFDSIVVAAPDKTAACAIRPKGGWVYPGEPEEGVNLTVTLIGITHLPVGVVHSSFNAA